MTPPESRLRILTPERRAPLSPPAHVHVRRLEEPCRSILKSINTGDTAWVLASAALVLLMTPGLAFFYGGMVRAKNVLGMLMQNFFCIGIISVRLGAGCTYSIAFGGSNAYFGGFHFAGLQHMDQQVPGGIGADHPARWSSSRSS